MVSTGSVVSSPGSDLYTMGLAFSVFRSVQKANMIKFTLNVKKEVRSSKSSEAKTSTNIRVLNLKDAWINSSFSVSQAQQFTELTDL